MMTLDDAVPVSGGHPDFRLLFQATPASCLALSPDLTVVAASDAYLAVIGVRREALLGRDVVDALKGLQAWPYVAELRAALCRVIAQKQAGVMARQTIRRACAGGGFEEGAWNARCAPVFADGATLAYLLHWIEPADERARAQGWARRR